MENEVLITGIFVGSGLLAYVFIPGFLVMWDRVLDHMESSNGGETLRQEKRRRNRQGYDPPATSLLQ